ncbi:MAG TPA: topoisomerase DNA-binding C4 zinc finger domain-containing protein, partial [Tepidisphaeraceae bacterium]|nr:topoisomerase DNA-binding C4 zinc finger domain-containing protein [Tepidisphaeraceae bacterium]
TPSPYICEKCGRPMVYRISKSGFFLSCSGYPECNGTRPVDRQGKPSVREVSEHKCPECDKPMIKRRGRFGEFLGCSGYPECKTILNLDKEGNLLPPKAPPVETTIKCDKCGTGTLLLRDGKRGPWLGCSNFPKCRGMKGMNKLEGEALKQVEALVPLLKEGATKAREMVAKILGENPVAASSNGKTGPIATDIDCDECGKPMVIREGRRGKFLGCSGYPKCKNTGEVPAKLLEEMSLNGNGHAGNGHAGNGQASRDGKPGAKGKAKADAQPVDGEDDIPTDLSVE